MTTKRKPDLCLRVTSISEIETTTPCPTSGWGENGKVIFVSGKIVDIVISKDGKSKVGIRILDDGSLIVTSYDTRFTQTVDTNLTLKNERPW